MRSIPLQMTHAMLMPGVVAAIQRSRLPRAWNKRRVLAALHLEMHLTSSG